ncbi:MAG: FG-GAP-like repeat-containing protein [Actinomadura sp.]
MRSRVFARTVAVAAITALGGLGLAGLAPSASAVMPPKAFDFNGDGYRDLAIGSPYGKVGTKTSAGFVSVIYGSSSGLNTAKKKVFTQDSAGVPGAAEAYDHFGNSLASADFDGDGYGDLAIGAPDEDTGGGSNAGLVTILWGTPSGLTTFAQTIEAFEPTSGARWGENLTTGDVEHDGTPEIFATMPGISGFDFFHFSSTGAAAAGTGGARAAVRSGGAVTLPRGGGDVSAQSLEDVNNSFLATGDVTGDGHDDVVYAFYDADWSVAAERRGFYVLPGNAEGGLDGGSPIFTEAGSVAVGDFEADGFEDVVVGQPAVTKSGGQVTVFKGSATGVTTAAKTSIHQDTAGVPDVAASGDGLGSSLAVGDVNKDGLADLAVGGPGDNVNGVVDSGRAWVLFGSAAGLTGTGAQTVSQSTTNVPGSSEKSDRFGYQVTLLDHTRNGAADLVVGAPGENGRDGAITLFKGGTAGILPVSGAQQLGTGTFGVTGKAAELGLRLGR